jgi:hypothetical protein
MLCNEARPFRARLKSKTGNSCDTRHRAIRVETRTCAKNIPHGRECGASGPALGSVTRLSDNQFSIFSIAD